MEREDERREASLARVLFLSDCGSGGDYRRLFATKACVAWHTSNREHGAWLMKEGEARAVTAIATDLAICFTARAVTVIATDLAIDCTARSTTAVLMLQSRNPFASDTLISGSPNGNLERSGANW